MEFSLTLQEAALLLSRTHPCSVELWEKTTKVISHAKAFCHGYYVIKLAFECKLGWYYLKRSIVTFN